MSFGKISRNQETPKVSGFDFGADRSKCGVNMHMSMHKQKRIWRMNKFLTGIHDQKLFQTFLSEA